MTNRTFNIQLEETNGRLPYPIVADETGKILGTWSEKYKSVIGFSPNHKKFSIGKNFHEIIRDENWQYVKGKFIIVCDHNNGWFTLTTLIDDMKVRS